MTLGVLKRGLLGLALCAAPALQGCSTNPATGEQSFTAFMPPEQERRVGAQEDPKIRRQFGGAYDYPGLSAYVNRIGGELVRHSEMPNLRFRFVVLNSPTVNAFALPGGYIYVTRGLLSLADSEAELAGVLAHEIAHVTARHTAQRYSRTVVTGIGATLLGALIGNRGAADLVSFGANLYLKSYSREHEMEADTLGIRYLARAGYEVTAMASFLEKLRAHGKFLASTKPGARDPDSGDLMATHPRTLDRVRAAVTQARARPVRSPKIGRDDYLARVDGILHGDDPSQGVVRGEEFLHPTLGFKFRVPPGFKIINRPDQVIAVGPDGVRIAFDRARHGAKGNLTHYLRQVWGANLPIHQAEALAVNGMEASTGIARVSTRQGPVDVRLVVYRFDADTTYRFLFLTPPEVTKSYGVALRRVTYSLRRLSNRERQRIPVARVAVRRVNPGQGVDELLRQMAPAWRSETLLRALNGLGPGERPRPGARLKLIVEADAQS